MINVLTLTSALSSSRILLMADTLDLNVIDLGSKINIFTHQSCQPSQYFWGMMGKENKIIQSTTVILKFNISDSKTSQKQILFYLFWTYSMF